MGMAMDLPQFLAWRVQEQWAAVFLLLALVVVHVVLMIRVLLLLCLPTLHAGARLKVTRDTPWLALV